MLAGSGQQPALVTMRSGKSGALRGVEQETAARTGWLRAGAWSMVGLGPRDDGVRERSGSFNHH